MGERRRGRPGSPRRRPRPAPRVDVARAAALDVLTAVRTRDAYANLVLPRLLRDRGIAGRDAAFTTELVSGTIRGQATYDAILAACVDRPLGDVDPAVLDALRLGVHQTLAMRVPAHAAVATTVDLVRARVGHRPAGFANAVLRTVAAQDIGSWIARVAPDPARNPIGYAAIAFSHPARVVEALGRALAQSPWERSGLPREGGATAPTPEGVTCSTELDELLAADNAPPRVTLVARPGLSTVEELEAAGGVRSAQSPYAVELRGGDPREIPAVAEGRAGVQDEGSQLVALALADAPLERRDELWLDLCAGPGGKSALLAAIAGKRSARLLASEVQPHRAGLVRSGTSAMAARRESGLLGVVAADGTRPAWRPGSFDRVMVDAPCTGLGALRRRPEARWRRRATDLDTLVPLQQALLDAALDSVRAGGVVAYVTCSPVLDETAGVVSAVLSARGDAALEDAAPLFGTVPDLQSDRMALPGTVQLWPHRHGTDAMFFALLRKL